jgi:formylmethanofuran dehydrogenase subunit E
MRQNELDLWKKCVEFHGHACGGLAIGFKAALYALELLDAQCAQDEEVVCISENDACGVDAIQVITGCSIGKGNLLIRMKGKQAFNFYNRKNGKSIRIYTKERPAGMSKEESLQYRLNSPYEVLFTTGKVKEEVPTKAKIFKNCTCESCGEVTAEPMIRLENGKKLCLDCYEFYER